MNYERHYGLLIERAKARTLEGYSELHHILPRCLGGGDERENLVRLSPEEHFLAHQLLAKIHPESLGIRYAAFAMGNESGKKYGWLRRSYASAMRGEMNPMKNPETAMKTGLVLRGRVYSQETLAKMSASKRGDKHFSFGKKNPGHSLAMRGDSNPSKREEVRRKQSAAHLGVKKPLLACVNCGKLMDAGNLKRWHSKSCETSAERSSD